MISKFHGLAAIAVCALSAPAFADPVKVVAAENVYGDLASEIGGANVAVTSILSNPDQDPHLFEASPDTAKALTDAEVVIVNGVDYDPWMEKLLSAHKAAGRKEIIVGALVGHKPGDNPHLVVRSGHYEGRGQGARRRSCRRRSGAQGGLRAGLRDVPRFAEAARTTRSPPCASPTPVQPITASEPVFGYQAGLIGLKVRTKNTRLRS